MEEKWIHLRQTVLEAILRVGRTPQIVTGRLRSTKNNTPLRPIVVAVLHTMQPNTWLVYSSALVGKNCHSIKNTKELVDKLRGLEIPPARKLVACDVTALFTSVLVDKALEVIRERDYKKMTP